MKKLFSRQSFLPDYDPVATPAETKKTQKDEPPEKEQLNPESLEKLMNTPEVMDLLIKLSKAYGDK